MQIVKLIQGTNAWHAHRATHWNASDAPAMMGCSSYKTRNKLLHELKTGIAPEVDAATQYRFDKGHEFEALARDLAAHEVGDDLYPVVGTSGKYSASFDGLTIDYATGFEHKSLNETLRSIVNFVGQELPLEYRVQMEHQMLVSGASRTLFMATNWRDGEKVEGRHCWYASTPELRAQIIAGWAQFEEDLANYVPVEVVAAPVAKAATNLLVVFDMRVKGELVSCNLEHYKPAAEAYLAAINSTLTTDQHFADAVTDAKFCRESAKKLALSIEQALGQMGDVNTAMNIVREVQAMFDAKALALEKLVKTEKDNRKLAIVQGGRDAMSAHMSALNTRLGKPYMPKLPQEFEGVIRGLKTFSSIENAVDTELARLKIEANQVADRIQINLNVLREKAMDYVFLFADTATIVLKANDDFEALVANRINDHKAMEAARIEREAEAARMEREAIFAANAKEQLRLDALLSAKDAAQTLIQTAPIAAAPTPVAVNPIAAPVTPIVQKPPQTAWTAENRPSDTEIVNVLAAHFKAPQESVLEWLTDLDFDALTDDLAVAA